jgi:hypothetical protein
VVDEDQEERDGRTGVGHDGTLRHFLPMALSCVRWPRR